MSNITKDWAKSVLDSYDSSLTRLTQKYLSTLSSIDSEHNLKNRQIESDALKRKNSSDASSKVDLANVKSSLLQKGLSKSGDSVQAELDNNLQRMSAISQIESDAERAKQSNEESRSKAKNSAYASYISGVGSIEEARNEAYLKQLNADREYEADRDDEMYDRFADNRDYEAKRDDEKYDRFADNRDYEAKREDEKYDRFADNRDYEAKKESTLKDDSKTTVTTSKETGSSTLESVTPNYNAKTLVDKIVSTYRGKYGDNEKTKNTINHALRTIINDVALDYSYRYQVKLYARALGLY